MYEQRSNHKGKGLSQLLIKYGLVRNEQQAQIVLISIIVVGVLIILILNRPGAHTPSPVDTEEDLQFDQMVEEEAVDFE